MGNCANNAVEDSDIDFMAYCKALSEDYEIVKMKGYTAYGPVFKVIDRKTG